MSGLQLRFPNPDTFGERTRELPHEKIDAEHHRPLTEFTEETQ